MNAATGEWNGARGRRRAQLLHNRTRGIEKMSINDSIRRVSVVSTGHVQIRPDHVSSTWRPMFLWLLTSRQWTGPRPINAYVIEHRDGVVLFDTGQDRASVTDPDYFPVGIARVLYDRLARFEIGPQETLSARHWTGSATQPATSTRRSSPTSIRTTSEDSGSSAE